MRFHFCLWATTLVALALISIGCDRAGTGNHPPVVKAGGTVLYKGQPIEGAEVTFNNKEANQTASAKTDASGHFQLSTFGKDDGAVPGHQLVAIRRVDVIDKTPANVDVSAGGQALPPEIRWIVPQKYSDAAKSGLTADVKSGEPNDFKFDLQ